jgi:GNAT superfamily N-acetyltransferase
VLAVADIEIRSAVVEDAPVLSDLCRQLGYERSPAAIERWITGAGEPDVAFVAVVDGQVAGWVQAHDVELLVYPRFLEIGGLVVADHVRRSGIGRALMGAAVAWGRQSGHTEVRLRSNVVRHDAHAFYKSLGFESNKTSYTFTMDIR